LKPATVTTPFNRREYAVSYVQSVSSHALAEEMNKRKLAHMLSYMLSYMLVYNQSPKRTPGSFKVLAILSNSQLSTIIASPDAKGGLEVLQIFCLLTPEP
jgi:hypothetical protein